MFAWPSQSAMLAVSIPACRSVIAQVCRSVCGVTFFPLREGHCWAADWTCRATSLVTRAAVTKLVARHVQSAAQQCPSLSGKNVTPHTLRHTCAMTLLHAGIDTASIALWLGHTNIQTTQVYLHADLELKRRTLDRLPSI